MARRPLEIAVIRRFDGCRNDLSRAAQRAGSAHSESRIPKSAIRIRPDSACAFTLVELIVVLIIVALVLGISIPALNKMQADAGFSAAIQTVNTVLSRAHIESIADRNMTAVRFLPGYWDVEDKDTNKQPDQMHVATYRYKLQTQDPTDPTGARVKFTERFERREDSASVPLPVGVWAAPLEALEHTGKLPAITPSGLAPGILSGPIGRADGAGFAFDPGDITASGGATKLLNADDFLIVFDPANGVRNAAARTKYPLLGYSPVDRLEVDRKPGASGNNPELFRRYGFGGVVFYKRDAFVSLGPDGIAKARLVARQNSLLRDGRPFMVHRFGGGLVSAEKRQ